MELYEGYWNVKSSEIWCKTLQENDQKLVALEFA